MNEIRGPFTSPTKERKVNDRELIKLIQQYPRQTLSDVSPQAASLKSVVKLPLVLWTATDGALLTLAFTFYKFIGELAQERSILNAWCLVLCLLPIALFCSVYQLVLLNRLMQRFD